MNILISGGTGFIGRHLVAFWPSHDISIIGRDKQKIHRIFQDNVNAYDWSDLNTLKPENFDVVVNLAGESINHFRWTNRIKNKITKSRLDITKILVDWCIKDPSKKIRLLSASGLSIYGLYSTLSTLFTEQSEPHGNGFMAEVANSWEKAAKMAQDYNIQTSIMRFAMVLDAKEGALPKILLPYRFYLGYQIGSGEQPVSWISINDLVRAIDYVMMNNIVGTINMVSPIIESQKQFSKTISEVLRKPCFLKLSPYFCKLLFGQMGNELLLHGQHAYPERLLEHNFSFSQDNLKKTLVELDIS